MQKANELFNTLSRALAYLLGGMFLYTTSSIGGLTKTDARTLEVFGAIFMAFAFFVLLSLYITGFPVGLNEVIGGLS